MHEHIQQTIYEHIKCIQIHENLTTLQQFHEHYENQITSIGN